MARLAARPGQQALGGTIRIGLAEALLLPTGFLTAAFLTRSLGPANYGLFTIAATLVAWIEWSITSIFSRVTVKFVGEDADWRPIGATLVRLHMVVSSAAALLLWLAAARIAGAFQELALGAYLRLFALDIPLFTLAIVHRDILTGLGAFQQRAIGTAGRWIARLLLIVLLVNLGLSVSGAILGSIGASVVHLAASRMYVRPALLGRAVRPSAQLWGYAGPLFLSAVSLRLVDKVDLFALKLLGSSAEQAGIYGAAQNLAIVPGVFALAFTPVLLATLTHRLRTGDRPSAGLLARNALRISCWLLPFAGMTAGAAPEIVRLLFGPAFVAAAPLLVWLIFGGVALALISVATTIMIAAGKPGWTVVLAVPLLFLAIAGQFIAVPRFGTIGAACVTALVAGLGAIAAVAAVFRIWKILPPMATLARSLFVCGAAYLIAALWPTPGLVLLLKIPIICSAIPLALLALDEFSAGEIAVARSLARQRGWAGRQAREDA